MSAHRSIRRRLLVMLISTIMLVWLVVLILVYGVAEHEVEEVFDADLACSARILQSLLLHEVGEEQETAANVRMVAEELGVEWIRSHPRLAAILNEYLDEGGKEKLERIGAARDAGHGYGPGLAFVARYGDGTVMMRDRTAAEIPMAPDGYADLQLEGEHWRVFSLTEKQTGFVVQVGEKQAFRAELVRYIT